MAKKKIYFIVESKFPARNGLPEQNLFTPKYRFEDEPVDSEGYELHIGARYNNLDQVGPVIQNYIANEATEVIAVYDYTPPVFTKR